MCYSFLYSAKSLIKDKTIDQIKALYYLANGSLCLAWALSSLFHKNSISDIEVELVEPQGDDDYGQETETKNDDEID